MVNENSWKNQRGEWIKKYSARGITYLSPLHTTIYRNDLFVQSELQIATICFWEKLNFVLLLYFTAEYIQACSRNDPHLNECALKSAKESLYQFSQGDQNRGLSPLDPIHVAEMTVFVPNENGLKLVFKKNDFTGLSAMQLESLKWVTKKLSHDCNRRAW